MSGAGLVTDSSILDEYVDLSECILGGIFEGQESKVVVGRVCTCMCMCLSWVTCEGDGCHRCPCRSRACLRLLALTPA